MEKSPTRQSRRLLSKRLRSGESVDVRALHREAESHLLKLPPEIFLRITHLLTVRAILSIRQTSYLSRLKTDNEAIWKDKFYGSYRLHESEVEIFRDHTPITGNWMDEIKKSVRITLWTTLRVPNKLSTWIKYGGDMEDMMDADNYRCLRAVHQITLHPMCTILGLIRMMCSRAGVDPDQCLIGLYPIKWMRFLRDHEDSCLEWDSTDGNMLVSRNIGSCIQEHGRPYHVLVHITQPEGSNIRLVTSYYGEKHPMGNSNRLIMLGQKWYRSDLAIMQEEKNLGAQHLSTHGDLKLWGYSLGSTVAEGTCVSEIDTELYASSSDEEIKTMKKRMKKR